MMLNSALVRGLLMDLSPLKGREFRMISYTSGPTLGNFEAGALASLVGVRASVVSGGLMCVVGTGVMLAFLPAFWRYDARDRVPA